MPRTMGYSLTVYAVDLEEMKSRIAAQDRTWFRQIAEGHREDLEGYDEEIEEMWDESEDESSGGVFGAIKGLFGKKPAPVEKGPEPEMPTGEQCLESLMLGGTKYESIGFVYGYMFEWLCQDLGDRCSVPGLESMRSGSGWLDSLDKGLQRHGVDAPAFSLEAMLSSRGAPIDMPKFEDFPSIGYVTYQEAVRAAPMLDAVDTEAFAAATESPEYAKQSLESCRRMVRTAVERKCGLVGFYY